MDDVLWSMNVHNKLDHLKLLQANIIERYPDLDIHVFCNCGENSKDSFSGHHEKYFDWEENTGHHNGVRDAFNCVKRRFSDSDYEYIVFSHADNLWSDIGKVEEIIDVMRCCSLGFANLSGHGELGAMGEKRHFGYFADFVVFSRETLQKLPFINEKLDGAVWIEVTLANIVKGVLDQSEIFDVSCKMSGRGSRNTFENVMGSGEWMSASHNVGQKMDMLQAHDVDLYNKIKEMIQ